MKVAELLKISSGTMKMLSKFDIRMSDYKYLDMFSEYEDLAGKGCKISSVVMCLSEKYSISEATVYRIIKRFKTTI